MAEPEAKSAAVAAPRPSVLSLNINSKSALYAAYMPQLRNGGIKRRTRIGSSLLAV